MTAAAPERLDPPPTWAVMAPGMGETGRTPSAPDRSAVEAITQHQEQK